MRQTTNNPFDLLIKEMVNQQVNDSFKIFKKEQKELIKSIVSEILNKDEVLNSRQVMAILQISEPTLIKLEEQKIIRPKYIGRIKRYQRKDIMNYMNKN